MKDAVNDATSKEIVADYRFTQKGNVVYLFVRNPATARVDIPELAKNKLAIRSISLLGNTSKVTWTQGKEALTLTLPTVKDQRIPIYVYKIQPKHN
ncbi:hypothetical protein KUH03_08385 [Sphingobacterium sp. E70]|nr:hypothetical protein KUH03_08385 [Sphingobacterium sp. E70]